MARAFSRALQLNLGRCRCSISSCATTAASPSTYFSSFNTKASVHYSRHHAASHFTQRATFSSRRKKRKSSACPFNTLGVTPNTNYATVKQSFLKLAMQHHPDTAAANSDSEADAEEIRREAVQTFMTIREAFESILQRPDGTAALRSETEYDDVMSDPEFNDWFQSETGHEAPNPFDLNLSEETLREVAASQDQAGLDRGGMWHMASMVTQGLNAMGGVEGAGRQLRLEQGEIKEGGVGGGKVKIRRLKRRNRNG